MTAKPAYHITAQIQTNTIIQHCGDKLSKAIIVDIESAIRYDIGQIFQFIKLLYCLLMHVMQYAYFSTIM